MLADWCSLGFFCRLVSAPIIEAAEIVEKLSMRDDKTLRMTLFSLQKFIRVRPVHSSSMPGEGSYYM